MILDVQEMQETCEENLRTTTAAKARDGATESRTTHGVRRDALSAAGPGTFDTCERVGQARRELRDAVDRSIADREQYQRSAPPVMDEGDANEEVPERFDNPV